MPAPDDTSTPGSDPHANPAGGPQSPRGESLGRSTTDMLERRLWAKILIGMVAGTVLGLILSPQGGAYLSDATADRFAEWIALPGVIFLGLLQMVVVPLVICSIITGISDSGSLGFVRRIGWRVVLYFVATTSIAITIGITVATVMQPGSMLDPDYVRQALEGTGAAGNVPERTLQDLTIPDRIANMIPTNLAQAQLDKNMLQLVIASIITGLVILTIPGKSARPVLDLCRSIQVIAMRIVSWAMILAPYAVFGLLCSITLQLGLDAILSVGHYAAAVLAGLIAMVAVYGGIVGVFSALGPGFFFTRIREAQLIAFSTSSSAATMPVSIRVAEEKLNLPNTVTRFTIPLGATINMDGTALYQAVAALFVCQVFGIDLSPGELAILLATTVGASIGTPAIPGVGIVVLATILTGIGVPTEGIALILGVDRILDMCRTTVNVTGDLTATAVMTRWLGLGRETDRQKISNAPRGDDMQAHAGDTL